MKIVQEKGITLVTLAITIIIIIILATITIDITFGDNGLIKQADISKEMAANITSKEQENANSLEIEYANLMAEDSERTEVDVKSEIEIARDEGTIFDEATPLSDEHGNVVVVPDGFMIPKDSGVTVQEGVVIEDVNASGDEAVQGSQYVWIPVGEFTKDDGSTASITLGRYSFSDSTVTATQPELIQSAFNEDGSLNYVTSIPIGYYSESVSYMPGTAGTSERNTTAYDLPGFLGSARENGGYYIGRYEASYASGVTSGTTVDYGNCKAASKVSTGYSETSMDYTPGTLWNYITQLDASTVAMTTYFSGQITGGIKSDLMNSYAWDTAIMYIHEAANSNYAYQEGTELNTSLTDTGANDDEVCKINDMASNISEWTTETSDDNRNYWSGPCTYRGGNYEASWTAFRNCYKPTNANANIGFRIVLYL